MSVSAQGDIKTLLTTVIERLEKTDKTIEGMRTDLHEDRIKRVQDLASQNTAIALIDNRLRLTEEISSSISKEKVPDRMKIIEGTYGRLRNLLWSVLTVVVLASLTFGINAYVAYSQGRLQSTGEKKQMIEDIAKEIVKQQKEQD